MSRPASSAEKTECYTDLRPRQRDVRRVVEFRGARFQRVKQCLHFSGQDWARVPR
jgi:hypothetical protein